MIWFQFIISAAVILVAGEKLTKYADDLSEALNLGKVWIGVVLLGLVTSLPEAGSSIISVAAFKANDLAAGNMAGSNNFNLLLILFLDIYYRRGSITNLVTYSRSHALTARFALTLAGVVILEILLSQIFVIPSFLGISLGSVLIYILFFYGMRAVYLSSPNPELLIGETTEKQKYSLRRIYLGLIISALFVVGGAVFLAGSADRIADITGLGRTFVGALLLAAATSLPELVVTISALKLNETDLAIGNIFGSNMMNMFILALCDPFLPEKALLQNVSLANVFTLLVGFLLTAVVIKGLKQSRKWRKWNVGWDSWTILVIYIASIIILYYIT